MSLWSSSATGPENGDMGFITFAGVSEGEPTIDSTQPSGFWLDGFPAICGILLKSGLIKIGKFAYFNPRLNSSIDALIVASRVSASLRIKNLKALRIAEQPIAAAFGHFLDGEVKIAVKLVLRIGDFLK